MLENIRIVVADGDGAQDTRCETGYQKKVCTEKRNTREGSRETEKTVAKSSRMVFGNVALRTQKFDEK